MPQTNEQMLIKKKFSELEVGDLLQLKLSNKEVLAVCGKLVAVSRALSPGYDGWWDEETLRDVQGWTGKAYTHRRK